MEIGKTLYVVERSAWRAWLEAHYRSEPEIWLEFPRAGSGRPRLAYADAVEEALCFGWIDSIVKSLDAGSAVQRFTPRRRGSPYSQTNKERMHRLIQRGLVREDVMPPLEEIDPTAFVFPDDIMRALRADRKAWANFRAFPAPYQRIRVAYVETARARPEEFDKRLARLIEMTRQGKRFGHGIDAFI